MKRNFIYLEKTDSTNRYLREYQPTGDEGMTVVVAEQQTAGRGQGTHVWESAAGKNLTFSILVRPVDVQVANQFILSKAVSLAIRDALSRYLEPVEIKWPNDIYYQRQKICGILIENRVSGGVIRECILGIGIDVNQRRFPSHLPNPVSLYQVLGHEVDRPELLRLILDYFEEYLRLVNEGEYSLISTKYLSAMFRLGGFHRYQDVDGEFEAEIVTVEESGSLVLHRRDGHVSKYTFGELSFIL